MALGALSAACVAWFGRRRLVQRARPFAERCRRVARRSTGRLRGLGYRLRRARPDPDVPDLVLADRIRSTIGPLERRLDVPRVHVMVENHTALLHGEVASVDDARAIEEAVSRVSGVAGVESYLHVGLTRGDTRPSGGRHEQASPARRRLVEAARAAGVPDDHAVAAVRAVLATFAERVPTDELDHVLAHLPEDVRSMLERPRRSGMPRRHDPRAALLGAVAAVTPRGEEVAPAVVAAVLGELRRLVPEEAADLAAVLPGELRRWWEEAAEPARGAGPETGAGSDAL
ncbi:MAG TPA: DUF2267 domain-containing protein [Acidimicrobiales bacterium]|nr:DUF2267 domain-containing protein [Acidimicrobiales bacterium]